MNDRITLLRLAITTWGENAQIDMCLEEMSELAKALLKWRRYGGDVFMSDKAVLEEIADVQIMLDQMRILFGSTDTYEAVKLERLEKRLNREDIT